MSFKRFFILSFFSVFLFSCESTKFVSTEKEIELQGNPTTGYTWLHTIEDESVISVKKEVIYLGDKNRMGAPSLFKYKIKSLKSGKTSIKFEYKRPWEVLPAEKIFNYEIIVDENGNIDLKD